MWGCFDKQSKSPFSSVYSSLISWSQIWQLGVVFVMLVLHHRGTTTSFSEALSCMSGPGSELSPLVKPLYVPNPITLAISEDLFNVLPVLLTYVIEFMLGQRYFRWCSIPLIKIVCGLLIPLTCPNWYLEVHWLCGFFTHTRSLILYNMCSFLL